MPARILYSVPIPESSQTREQSDISLNISQLGALSGGAPLVDQVSQAPVDLRITAQYRNPLAESMASELIELANSSGFDAVPLFSTGSKSPKDGYYAAESGDVSPMQPQEPRFQEATVRLTKKGTTKTHDMGVETTRWQADHSFGNNLDPFVSVPAVATNVRWYDRQTGTFTVTGTPSQTVAAEYGDVDQYALDAGESALSISNADRSPTIVYRIDHADVGVVDPVVWAAPWGDPYGEEYGTGYGGLVPKLNGDGVRQWQHVFVTSHDFRDSVPVLDSGRLRVFVFESSGELVAQTWDESNSEWSAVGLDWSGDWAVYDVDLSTISPVAVHGQFLFRNAATDELFALDGALVRGSDAILWDIPDNETGPIPSGLESTLEPIASPLLEGAQPEQTLVRRSEVQR